MYINAVYFIIIYFPYLRVDDFVLFQTDGVTEGFPAQLTRERPRAAVGAPGVDL